MQDTRTRLLRAAEQLFARDGIERTQIQAVTQLAGQRNTSALHYHFGSREGLLMAVLTPHLEDIEQLRATLLEDLVRRDATGNLRDLVTALVLPLGSKLATPAGHHYLMILQQCLGGLGWQPPPSASPAALKKLMGWLRAALHAMPKAIAEERIRFVVAAMVGAMAARVRDRAATRLSDALFLDNLIEMLHGALAQPHIGSSATSKRRVIGKSSKKIDKLLHL